MQNLRGAVQVKIDRLKARIAAEVRAAQAYERDRAHQATCGDRPFVGCGPCAPAGIERSGVARAIPAATRRH